ncbi:MAG: hypothetical protein EB121_05885, partial [Alphaproteobacteria bacterium]|nr:hypothetical protein [Alphaproteobacteria bacterium]
MVDRVSEKFVLARSSVDERSETLANARYIGLLRNNFTRLNVASALDNANDREDNFSFSVQTKGTLGMAYTTNEEVNMRFRLLERSTGRLIADSGAAEGSELKQRFDDLQANVRLLEQRVKAKA